MPKVNIAEKFALFADHWSPKVVGAVGAELINAFKGYIEDPLTMLL